MTIYSDLKTVTKKYLILDFDGMIFSLDWTHGEDLDVYRRRIRNMVAEIDEDLVKNFNPKERSYRLTDQLIEKHGESAKKRVIEFYREKEMTLIDTAKIHSDTIKFIKKNKRNFEFFIWSNNHSDVIRELLGRAGIQDAFTKIIGRDQFDISKPNPKGFEKIYEPEKHKLKDFIMIGDDLVSDKGAADAVGIDFLLYT